MKIDCYLSYSYRSEEDLIKNIKQALAMEGWKPTSISTELMRKSLKGLAYPDLHPFLLMEKNYNLKGMREFREGYLETSLEGSPLFQQWKLLGSR